MANPAIHYTGGVGGSTPSCGARGTATNDTDLVTCGRCRRIPANINAALGHRAVVEALAYPKEDHPCLSNP